MQTCQFRVSLKFVENIKVNLKVYYMIDKRVVPCHIPVDQVYPFNFRALFVKIVLIIKLGFQATGKTT